MRILLADDEDLILYSLTRMFRNGGADVTAVRNGREALRAFSNAAFDICILDVQLPDANGLELMKVFRNISPSTVIIIMTAASLDSEQQRSLGEYRCHFLPKPFELYKVHALLEEVYRRSTTGEG